MTRGASDSHGAWARSGLSNNASGFVACARRAEADAPKYMSIEEQARRFQMAVNVEGSGGWADRQRHLLLSGMVVLRQAVGVHEWWEPLLTPYAHYVHALRCTRWYRISMESGSSPEAISA